MTRPAVLLSVVLAWNIADAGVTQNAIHIQCRPQVRLFRASINRRYMNMTKSKQTGQLYYISYKTLQYTVFGFCCDDYTVLTSYRAKFSSYYFQGIIFSNLNFVPTAFDIFIVILKSYPSKGKIVLQIFGPSTVSYFLYFRFFSKTCVAMSIVTHDVCWWIFVSAVLI